VGAGRREPPDDAVGFGLAGVGDIAIVASLVAILAFTLGAVIGGRWAVGRAPHRGHLLAAAAATQAGLVVVAAVVAETAGVRDLAARLILVGLLAVAMGGTAEGGYARPIMPPIGRLCGRLRQPRAVRL
jgi:hypothetical protein